MRLMCIICNPALSSAFRNLSFKSRRQFLGGAAAATAGAFFAEAVGPALADGSVNEVIERGLGESAATIFVAQKIITMDRANPTATPVAVAGVDIVAVGSLDEVKAALGSRPYRIDETFAGKIVTPGFIDQHLHPILGALTLAVAVIAPEDWKLPNKLYAAAATPDAYRVRLKAAEASLTDPKEWLISWGYHPLWHGKLSRGDLNAISTTRPIAVWHASCSLPARQCVHVGSGQGFATDPPVAAFDLLDHAPGDAAHVFAFD
jgi:hypothetical protein